METLLTELLLGEWNYSETESNGGRLVNVGGILSNKRFDSIYNEGEYAFATVRKLWPCIVTKYVC